jgi:hypothetical protein
MLTTGETYADPGGATTTRAANPARTTPASSPSSNAWATRSRCRRALPADQRDFLFRDDDRSATPSRAERRVDWDHRGRGRCRWSRCCRCRAGRSKRRPGWCARAGVGWRSAGRARGPSRRRARDGADAVRSVGGQRPRRRPGGVPRVRRRLTRRFSAARRRAARRVRRSGLRVRGRSRAGTCCRSRRSRRPCPSRPLGRGRRRRARRRR